MQNPYAPAVAWIREASTTGSGIGLAKLILSLWNDDAAFSFRECTRSFDPTRASWALRIVAHFLAAGEDAFLREAGRQVCDICPRVWDEGYAGSEAKRAIVREWERQCEERVRIEQPELFED